MLKNQERKKNLKLIYVKPVNNNYSYFWIKASLNQTKVE